MQAANLVLAALGDEVDIGSSKPLVLIGTSENPSLLQRDFCKLYKTRGSAVGNECQIHHVKPIKNHHRWMEARQLDPWIRFASILNELSSVQHP